MAFSTQEISSKPCDWPTRDYIYTVVSKRDSLKVNLAYFLEVFQVALIKICELFCNFKYKM